MTDATEFSQYLTRQRSRLEMSQHDLANFLGCSISIIQKWEAGDRRPKPLTRAAIEIQLQQAKPAKK